MRSSFAMADAKEVTKTGRVDGQRRGGPVAGNRNVWGIAFVVISLMMWCVIPAEPALAAPEPATAPGLFRQVDVGDRSVCVLNDARDAVCWDHNVNQDTEDEEGGRSSSLPPLVAGPFQSISVGEDHACGVREDQSLACWGDDSYGRAPESVPGPFISVTTSTLSTCALRLNGDLLCWGWGWGSSVEPVHLSGPFLSVSAGFYITCALRASDRAAVCWNDYGFNPAQTQVAGPFTSISGGESDVCGLRENGDITCWGSNSSGEAPPMVAGPFSSVAVGDSHSCAIKEPSGSLVCWGNIATNQAPGEAAGPFASISADASATCALRTDRTLTCWGRPTILPTLPQPPRPTHVTATVGQRVENAFDAPVRQAPAFSLKGSLPSGLALAPDGTWTGMPRSSGTFNSTVTARNVMGSASAGFTLDVKPTTGFDANGDGLPDIAIGVPGEDIAHRVNAGAVSVLYGAPDGSYGKRGGRLIAQEDVGLHSEKGDRFGAALSLADVTGDKYVDLIIGAPGENRGAGQVIVVHGSRKGLSTSKFTVLRQGRAGAAGTAERGDGFGTAVSVGDGLWVGAPGEDLGRATNAGVATRFKIKPLRSKGSIQYRQGTRKVPGKPERGDRFGAALSGGGMIIGVPGEDVGRIVDAGIITWQLTGAISQNSPYVPGTAERGDRFGAAVASGSGQPGLLLAVGAPGEDVGALKDAGAVTTGLDRFDNGFADFLPAPASLRAGDRFGSALAFDAGGSNLIVGAPGDDVDAVRDGGSATEFTVRECDHDDDDCFNLEVEEGTTTLVQGRAGVPGPAAAGNAFGSTLSELPSVVGGVLIGAPGQRVDGHRSAGAVVVVNPEPIPAFELNQNRPGVPGTAEGGDSFGTLPAS